MPDGSALTKRDFSILAGEWLMIKPCKKGAGYE